MCNSYQADEAAAKDPVCQFLPSHETLIDGL